MAELDPAVEQQLADLDDADWRALTARVRPPTSSQQLREIAGRVLEGNALDSFVAIADPRKFANEIGDVDEDKVMGHLTALYGAGQRQQAPQWGQSSAAGGPGKRPGDDGRAALKRRRGDDGRAALKRRRGVDSSGDAPAPGGQIPRGQSGREALARRHGGKK